MYGYKIVLRVASIVSKVIYKAKRQETTSWASQNNARYI